MRREEMGEDKKAAEILSSLSIIKFMSASKKVWWRKLNDIGVAQL